MKNSALDRAGSAPRTARRYLNLLLWSLFLVCRLLLPAGIAQTTSSVNDDAAHHERDGYVGNAACAHCHPSIYESYSRTPMAHASGPAAENLMPADFVHSKSGVHYRIYSQGNAAWLSFERPGDPTLGGKLQLLYSIGSGRRGRSYLFAVDEFVFESPINWYSDRHRWDMAPAYGEAREIPLNLPAYPDCLRCHTSGTRPPVNGTANQYATPLFTQDGVGCERCHGPGAAHITGGAIVNPVKLQPDRRDAICMQCHLEGSVAIERAGRHAYDFRPGDSLDNYLRHYVFVASGDSALGANSQFEALAKSKCKIKSGDAMSCVSCHDPHSYQSGEQRAPYYRAKCLACHGEAFGLSHHPKQPDCTACHMPSSLSADIAHTEVTDHRIPARPQMSAELLQDSQLPRSSPSLNPFPYSKEAAADVRDEALAWQSLARGGSREAASEADRMLALAARQSPTDPEVLAGLAFVELRRGSVDRARELYQQALALDPNLIDASTNLGVIEARSGHFTVAVKLWETAFERAPAKSSIGMNLARTYCAAGQTGKTRTVLLRVLRFNPDLSEARKLLQHLNATPPSCGN